MTIFDTDIVTLLSYGNAKIRRRMDSMAETESLAVVVVTEMEILRGRCESILKAADEQELNLAMERFQQARDLLSSFAVVPVDPVAASRFEVLCNTKKIKKIGRGDLLIASVALAQNALLITRNMKHFGLIPGLRLENWAD